MLDTESGCDVSLDECTTAHANLVYSYIVRAVESEEGVGRKRRASGGEGMAYLEERIYRETLVQLCS